MNNYNPRLTHFAIFVRIYDPLELSAGQMMEKKSTFLIDNSGFPLAVQRFSKTRSASCANYHR